MLQWVVQENLINQADTERIRNAITELGYQYTGVKVIPFTKELPFFNVNPPTIVYGCTSLINNVRTKLPSYSKGIFFDPERFTMHQYKRKYGSALLNSDGWLCTVENLITAELPSYISFPAGEDEEWFIRPNDDSKSFTGEVMKVGDIKEWLSDVLLVENVNLDANSEIFIASPKKIDLEFRLFLVDSKVVGGSLYRRYGRLTKKALDFEEDAPLVTFAEQQAAIYSPHPIFVMDVGFIVPESRHIPDGFKIVECGCFNSVGFYDSDVKEIIKKVSERFQKGF